MAESSILWVTNDVGDGISTGYTQAQIIEWQRMLGHWDSTVDGIAPNYSSKLAPSDAGAHTVRTATGGALVYGFVYFNTANVDKVVTTPVIGTTGWRLVLRASWAAQTVRVTLLESPDGVACMPAATQTANTTWNWTLSTGTITTGNVLAITDTRGFHTTDVELILANVPAGMFTADATGQAKFADLFLPETKIAAGAVTETKLGNYAVTNQKVDTYAITEAKIDTGAVTSAHLASYTVSGGDINTYAVSGAKIDTSAVTAAKIDSDAVGIAAIGTMVPGFLGRQGGNATDWTIAGTNNYTSGLNVRTQCGVVAVATAGLVSVTFPVAFSNKPVVFATAWLTTSYAGIGVVTTSGASLYLYDHTGSAETGDISWLAIGPEA